MTGKYEIMYADFAWPYTSFGTAKLGYDQMSEQEIAEFDWSQFMAKRSVLFTWATGPKLNMALRCGEEWEKRHGLYYQGMAYIWVKTTNDGVPIKASGPRPRLVKPLGEVVLAYSTVKDGRCFPLLTERQVQHQFAPVEDDSLSELGTDYVLAPKQRKHSRKPSIFRDLIVELLGDRPRIELFARERVEGWDAWGNEVDGSGAPDIMDELV